MTGKVLPDLTTANNEVAALKAQIAALEAKVAQQKRISFKVSEKGALSVYGVHTRFPVTLYAEQWERLLSHAGELSAFIAANRSTLTRRA